MEREEAQPHLGHVPVPLMARGAPCALLLCRTSWITAETTRKTLHQACVNSAAGEAESSGKPPPTLPQHMGKAGAPSQGPWANSGLSKVPSGGLILC